MSRHAAVTHRAKKHRRVRPRRMRIVMGALALGITLVALLGGFGLLPDGNRAPASAAGRLPEAIPTAPSTLTATDPALPATQSGTRSAARIGDALPADSGSGRRIVFAIGAQRVWLVGADGRVASTYLVSGSLTHNLKPGDYHVFSRSRWAVGIDDSGVMQYFVRFAHGVNAAIGFHTIPTQNGHPLQTVAQLGTPRSHGCIRQARPDAIRLWDFAPVGTPVVVTA